MEGITSKDLFLNTQKAINTERLFSSNSNFLHCLKHIVLELNEAAGTNKTDTAMA